jgi:mannose-1-phosphate guanylyltransferase/mannose-6-phosphate isomerase
VIYPIPLCGGSGTRLWPLSRQRFTKQFVKLVGEESLFQTSASRFLGAGSQPSVIVASDHFGFIVAEQLAGVTMEAAATLIDPEPRNTAPAILSLDFLAPSAGTDCDNAGSFLPPCNPRCHAIS